MELVIHNFKVKDICFGEKNSFADGVLTLNKESLVSEVKKDEHILDVDIRLVKPGDKIRLCPVKDAIEPRSRADGRCLFPGVTGDLKFCGTGEIHALKGCSVVVVGKQWGGFQDGLIDMSGDGAKYTYFSGLNNIVLVASTDEEFEAKEQQKKNTALRLAGLRLAEYVGQVVKNLKSEDIEVLKLPKVNCNNGANNKLPNVVLVLQFQSQMEIIGYNTLLYGWDMNRMVPTLLNPNEVLDGAIVSGSFMPSSSKWSTYDIQNAPIIKELYGKHGLEINFLGVIASNLNVSLQEKERSAMIVASLAKYIGADGAIVAEEGYGNPDADFILCLSSLEDRGIKTVGLTNECTGRDGESQPLVSLDEKANALVTAGDVSDLICLPAMDEVIGDLNALSRDGMSGGWAFDEVLGPSVREDGTIIMENNAMFCGDQVLGWSTKVMKSF